MSDKQEQHVTGDTFPYGAVKDGLIGDFRIVRDQSFTVPMGRSTEDDLAQFSFVVCTKTLEHIPSGHRTDAHGIVIVCNSCSTVVYSDSGERPSIDSLHWSHQDARIHMYECKPEGTRGLPDLGYRDLESAAGLAFFKDPQFKTLDLVVKAQIRNDTERGLR